MERHEKHEIELRGLMDEDTHKNLRNNLIAKGYRHEEDDKVSFFFSWDKGILKVNDEISKKRGKISLKIGDEIQGSLREYEVMFQQESMPSVLSIFQELGFTKFHKVMQKRENFILDDLDVEIALKYTPDFRYHFEIEYIGDPAVSEENVKQHLRHVCKKLNITPMEEEELREKVRKIKIKYNLNV